MVGTFYNYSFMWKDPKWVKASGYCFYLCTCGLNHSIAYGDANYYFPWYFSQLHENGKTSSGYYRSPICSHTWYQAGSSSITNPTSEIRAGKTRGVEPKAKLEFIIGNGKIKVFLNDEFVYERST